MKKYATKRQGSIDPRALINKRNVINVIGFKVLIYRQGLDSWNINIVLKKYSVDCFVYFYSILYFTHQTHFCDCFHSVP